MFSLTQSTSSASFFEGKLAYVPSVLLYVCDDDETLTLQPEAKNFQELDDCELTTPFF